MERIGITAVVVGLSLAGCNGVIGDPHTEGAGTPEDRPYETAAPPAREELVAVSGLRRLSTHEYDATIRDLLGEIARPSGGVLPEDVRTPFDNDYTTQLMSQALVEGAESLAFEAARMVAADPAMRARVAGCEPAAPDDAVCLRELASELGRRAFRRPLEPAEIERYLGALEVAETTGDFWTAAEIVVAAILQDPRFLYRVELGTRVRGSDEVYALDGYEIATRLSYFLWGTTPDDRLLDLGGAGALDTAAGVREAAASMLEDERARVQIDRFHALWLGYETLPHDPTLAVGMRDETRALIDRVVFDDRRPWQDLFRAEETFVDDGLAEHYGLVPRGESGPAWVAYGDTGRRGLLSHGTFLALGAKAGDTSPTQRGREIRVRLMCQAIPDPPPGVDTDVPPPAVGEAVCKPDRFAVHNTGGCVGCHQLMDPVGFGLERFDQLGRYRTVEPDYRECEIAGTGEIVEQGAFSGPGELAELLIESGTLTPCAERQLYRFAMGRHELDATDDRFLAQLATEVGTGDILLQDLVLSIVTSEAFRYRRDPGAP